MSRKKVVHIVEAFGGGVFTFFTELANEMSKNLDVVIVYAKRKQTPENFKEYFNEKIKLIEVENFTRSINPIKDIKACMEVRKIIKQEKPDIVHMHSSKAGIIGRLVVSSKNRKLFYTPHGYAFLKQDDPKLKRIIYKAIEKCTALIKRKCKIVACSKGEYEESLKILKNSTYVNNGININEINTIIENNKESQINTKNLKICTIGRIGYQKNPELFNEIASKFPNIQFTWIGEGELREKITSENIDITGWMERKEVLKEVMNNDIFILPSLWEGLPIALLEAMYLKKVCIVSNVIGNKDVIQNGVNGFVCDNLNDYINVISQIQNDKYDLIKITHTARQNILDEYNVDVMCKKYEELYEE